MPDSESESNSRRRGIDFADRDCRRGWCRNTSLDNDHAVFAQFWAMKSRMVGRADEAIAAIRGQPEDSKASLAIAQAVLARSWHVASESLRIADAAIEVIRGTVEYPRRAAKAQAEDASRCEPKSRQSLRAEEAIDVQSGSTTTANFDKAQAMFVSAHASASPSATRPASTPPRP